MAETKANKFGVQVGKGKRISVFVNGEVLHTGCSILVNKTRFRTFEQLVHEIAKVVGTGIKPSDMKLYNTKLEQVKELEKIEDGGRYVVVGIEGLLKNKLPKHFIDPNSSLNPAMDQNHHQNQQQQQQEQAQEQQEEKKESKKAPVVQAYSTTTTETGGAAGGGAPEKFGTQTERAKHCFFFRNGDVHHQGVEIVIHPKKYKTIEQLKQELSKQIGLSTVAVKKIFDTRFQTVETLETIVDGGHYLCVGVEGLKKEALPRSFA